MPGHPSTNFRDGSSPLPDRGVEQETFQGRYILRHPWKGQPKCDAAKKYLATQPKAREQEAQNLARLTGWDIDKIRERTAEFVDKPKRPKE